jgi:hypothetical protein
MQTGGQEKKSTKAGAGIPYFPVEDNASVIENELIARLTHIIQRLEREGVNLTVDDIKMVWRAKIHLGYCTPERLEDGTGAMVKIYAIHD